MCVHHSVITQIKVFTYLHWVQMCVVSVTVQPYTSELLTCFSCIQVCARHSPTTYIKVLTCSSPQWGAADADIKVPSGENTPDVLPLKPGVGQYIAIHDTLTARDFFLAYFYHSGPFTCFFSKTSSNFVRSCVSLQNKIGQPAGCRFPCWVPAAYKLVKKKHDLWKNDDLWNNI